MGTRILTVSAQYPYTTIKRGYVEIPYIRLRGKWLQELGFNVGGKVQISCTGHGELNIKLIRD